MNQAEKNQASKELREKILKVLSATCTADSSDGCKYHYNCFECNADSIMSLLEAEGLYKRVEEIRDISGRNPDTEPKLITVYKFIPIQAKEK